MTTSNIFLRLRGGAVASAQDTISAQGAAMAQPVEPAGGPSPTTGRASHQLVVSFLTSGRVIAILGFFLPASMLAWSVMTGASIRGSLSEYYFTPMRDLMVGTLTTMAVFLWSYRGFSDRDADLRADRRVGKIAAIAALCIAFFPITPRNDDRCTLAQCIVGGRVSDLIHAGGATVFFLCLVAFCLVLLPRSVVNSDGYRRRVVLYRMCGVVIVTALVVIVVWKFLPIEVIFSLGRYRPIFWLESLAIWAFSTAWIVRGLALENAINDSFTMNQPAQGTPRLNRPDVAPAAP
ncbi:MAG: hypothetical protein Q4P15_04565 [Propionibacteriaceae bacterium]|nr:hypothetical protein [Propionibacteriaceae bacterium]